MAPVTLTLIAFTLLVVVAVARWSGHAWRKLHQAFGVPSWPVPSGKRVGRGKVGALEFKNMLVLSMDHMGFYLRLPRLLAIGTRPLFIPWNAVDRIDVERSLFGDRVKVTVGNPVITTIELPLKAVRGTRLDPEASTSEGPGLH